MYSKIQTNNHRETGTDCLPACMCATLVFDWSPRLRAAVCRHIRVLSRDARVQWRTQTDLKLDVRQFSKMNWTQC